MIQERLQEIKEFIQTTYQQGDQNINMSVCYQRQIGPQGCQLVASIINWPIEYLNLNMYAIKSEGMQTIIKNGQQWPTLKELRVQKNQICCDGLENLSMADWKHLQKFIIGKNKIKAKGFSQIVKCKWDKLKVLQLNYCQIGPGGSQFLGKINFPSLYALNLNFSLIGNEGLHELSKCSFPNLQFLNLSNNKIDGKGMFYLSKMQLPKLNSINLNRNQIGRQNGLISEIGCVYFTKSKIRSLSHLHIFGNDITLNGIKAIMESEVVGKGCFLELIRNLFTFSDIKEYLQKYEFQYNFFG